MRKPALELISHSIIDLTIVSDSGFAESTFAAGNIGTHGDPVTDFELGHFCSGFHNLAGYFVPDNCRVGDPAVSRMEDADIRSAYGTGMYFD